MLFHDTPLRYHYYFACHCFRHFDVDSAIAFFFSRRRYGLRHAMPPYTLMALPLYATRHYIITLILFRCFSPLPLRYAAYALMLISRCCCRFFSPPDAAVTAIIVVRCHYY